MKVILHNKIAVMLSLAVSHFVMCTISAVAAEAVIAERYDFAELKAGSLNGIMSEETPYFLTQESDFSDKKMPVVLNGFEFSKMDGISTAQSLKLLGGVEECAEKLSLFPDLLSLDISSATFGEKFLHQISLRTTLQKLNFEGTIGMITDNSLSFLKPLFWLRDLNISSTFVFGPGLSDLSGLSNLENLNASNTHVVAEHFIPLSELPKLRELNISSTFVDQDKLRQFKSSPKIINE